MSHRDDLTLRALIADLQRANAELTKRVRDAAGGIVSEHKQWNGSWFCHPGCTYRHQGYHVEACHFVKAKPEALAEARVHPSHDDIEAIPAHSRTGVRPPQASGAVGAPRFSEPDLLCTACGVRIAGAAWAGACPQCGNGTMRELEGEARVPLSPNLTICVECQRPRARTVPLPSGSHICEDCFYRLRDQPKGEARVPLSLEPDVATSARLHVCQTQGGWWSVRIHGPELWECLDDGSPRWAEMEIGRGDTKGAAEQAARQWLALFPAFGEARVPPVSALEETTHEDDVTRTGELAEGPAPQHASTTKKGL